MARLRARSFATARGSSLSLKPNALFGLEGLDPISHATLWSLAANLACFLVFSVLGRQTTVERNQAAAFADGVVRERYQNCPRAW